MAKTHGTRRKSRYKLKKTVREKGLSPISRAIQEFHEGDIVNIDLDPSIQNGMPHPKFQGRTGKVMTQRGMGLALGKASGEAGVSPDVPIRRGRMTRSKG